ncbi:unnamed protein product [Effrenium voratum]|uniref:Pentatricopeptide repeat-containing protein, chloroplastic n=1 Tax=Effrenium voratum TaxID=2562239 RepID=A0AA36I7E5_9DINO|nr:unnamed protein product [Effrenium voratum]
MGQIVPGCSEVCSAAAGEDKERITASSPVVAKEVLPGAEVVDLSERAAWLGCSNLFRKIHLNLYPDLGLRKELAGEDVYYHPSGRVHGLADFCSLVAAPRAPLSQRLARLGKRNWAEALRLYNEQRAQARQVGGTLETGAFNAVLGAVSDAGGHKCSGPGVGVPGGSWALAAAVLRHMALDRVAWSAVTLGAALGVCQADGAWARAGELLRRARSSSLELNVVHCTSVLHSCGQAAQLDSALGTLKEMRRWAVQPNQMTFSSAISACASAFQWQLALDVLDESVSPNLICFNSLLSALEKGRQPELALALLARMENSEEDLAPDVVSYSTAIRAMGSREWEKALELLGRMERRAVDPNVVTYGAAISACEGRVEVALSLLGRMRQKALRVNAVSCSSAISACEKARKWRTAVALFSELEEASANLICCNSLLSVLMMAGQAKKALALLAALPQLQVQPDVLSFGAALAACARAAQWRHAIHGLEAMAVQAVQPNVICYDACFSACERSGRFGLAMLREMSSQALESCAVLRASP